MANWKQLLHDILLADGTIDTAETKIMKKEILSDGQVDDEEVDFLVSLRNKAKSAGADFEAFFFEALTSNILADGNIDAPEAKKLRAILFADGKIDAGEKAFMQGLKKKAKKTDPSFDKLLE